MVVRPHCSVLSSARMDGSRNMVDELALCASRYVRLFIAVERSSSSVVVDFRFRELRSLADGVPARFETR
jgi:hypothetical protein